MKFLLLFIIFLGVANTALAQSTMAKFLSSFPTKMMCDGVEVSAITHKKTPLAQKVLVSFSEVHSDHPMIEVNAPSASVPHFKIGNGYEGTLNQIGSYSYLYDGDSGTLYYLPVIKTDDPVDATDILRVRDAGGLVYFSARTISFRAFRHLDISNCQEPHETAK